MPCGAMSHDFGSSRKAGAEDYLEAFILGCFSLMQTVLQRFFCFLGGRGGGYYNPIKD